MNVKVKRFPQAQLLVTFDQPLTTTLPSGDGPVYILDPPVVGGILGVAKGRPEPLVEVGPTPEAFDSIELAWSGVIVDIDGLAARTIPLSVCCIVSIKAIVGPATILSCARSTTSLRSAWLSLVIQMATGPSIPFGTMHWLNGREIEKGRPPASIWQKSP
jgi:hypothetical protein